MFTDEFLAQATQMEVVDGQVITRLFTAPDKRI
jgi:hypothetical protein